MNTIRLAVVFLHVSSLTIFRKSCLQRARLIAPKSLDYFTSSYRLSTLSTTQAISNAYVMKSWVPVNVLHTAYDILNCYQNSICRKKKERAMLNICFLKSLWQKYLSFLVKWFAPKISLINLIITINLIEFVILFHCNVVTTESMIKCEPTSYFTIRISQILDIYAFEQFSIARKAHFCRILEHRTVVILETSGLITV